ncbi:hypothetical protein JCM10449v2_005425 [Rhodotorula kratochvilovae]
MSDAPKGRGRGRGHRIGAHTLTGAVVNDQPSASPSPAPAASRASSVAASLAGEPTPAPTDATDDAPEGADDAAAGPSSPRKKAAAPAASAPQRRASVKRVASVGVGSMRAPSVGVGMSRTPSIGAGAAAGPAARDRPVGGLLGSTSEFRPGAAAAGGATGSKPKFKPNMRRTQRVEESDDEDVKMKDGDSFRKRGPRAPRARQELEMTASGPMAQGPGGPPRAWGARPSAGASGAAVMAASRAGTLNRMLDDDEDASDLEVDDDPLDGDGGGVRFKAVDLNDIGGETGAGADGDEAMTPLTLPRDPKVLRTKIRRLQERKVERLKKEARNKAKAEGLVKDEPGDDSLPSSAAGTPAPGASIADSKEGSIALVSVDEDKEAKDLKDLEEEEKKEIILSEAFDLAPEARGELYMFQFPRKFPSFVPVSPSPSSSAAAPEADVKPDPDAPAARKPVPPAWGRFGSRGEKAARWSAHEGRVGELCVHRSGKVTLKLAGDLRYEVLPAAQPSFLQEIAVLDHRPSAASSSSNGASSSSKKAKAKKHKRSSSSSSGSSSSSDERERDLPRDALVVLGQTSKKFLVVPEITDLLDKVALQEKEERDEERRVKLEKARAPVGAERAAAGKRR